MGEAHGALAEDAPVAPGRRWGRAVLTLATVILALLALAPLVEAKIVNTGFGRTFSFPASPGDGGYGGQFRGPKDIAINQNGAGGVDPGTIYVLEDQARVQRLSEDGEFERLWGQNVLGRDELQEVKLNNAVAGSFTLSLGGETTTPIPVELFPGSVSLRLPSLEEIDSALESLPSVGAGNINVGGNSFTGGPYVIRFIGTLGGTDVGPITGDASLLQAPEPTITPSISETYVQDGAGGPFAGFEICTVADECQNGDEQENFENGGALSRPDAIEVDQTTGEVYVSDIFNRRVVQYDADGNFLRTWGWDVVMAGRPNDKGEGFEVCDTTAGNVATDCKDGIAGSGAGQLTFGIRGGAIDSDGDFWVGDGNPSYRLTEFSSEGEFLRTVATGVVTDGAEGTGTLTSGSTTVTELTTTKGYFEVGRVVTGTGIAPGTTVTGVNQEAKTLSLSQAAEADGSQTLTVAPGTGDVDANEFQTFRFTGSLPKAGAFALKFEGETTGGYGTATFTGGSNVVTNVVTDDMSKFKVGQLVTGREFGYVEVLPPNTRITAVGGNTLTLSDPVGLTPTGTPLVIASMDIPYNATSAELEASLNGLGTIGGVGGSVGVTGSPGGPWKIEFKGTRFAGADVPMMELVTSFASSIWGLPIVKPPTSYSLTTETPNGLETCTVPTDCRPSSVGNALGQFGGAGGFSTPDHLAFDSGGNLYAADGRRIQKFNPSLTSVSLFSPSSFAPYTNEMVQAQVAVAGGERMLYAVNNKVSANETQLIELDTTGAVVETSLEEAGLPLGEVAGMDENEATGTLYVLTDSPESPRTVLVMRSTPPPAPVLDLDPVTDKTDTNAVFSGTIDPTGGLVKCAYEFSTDQENWDVVNEPKCVTLDQDGGSQPISQDLSAQDPPIELVPNSLYYVRLAVSRALIPNTVAHSDIEEFDTDAVPPVVNNLGSNEIDENSARIFVRINPRHSDTSYVVKYGTTPAMGSTTAPISIGDSPTPLILSQVIEGLSLGTKYFYEVVATSTPGTVGSGQKSFSTRANPLPLLDDRGYEQVSPPDKGSANIDSGPSGTNIGVTIAENGDAVAFCTGVSFGDPPGAFSLPCASYRSHRDEDRWVTEAATPNFCLFDNDANPSGYSAANVAGFDENLEHEIFYRPEGGSCPLPELDPAAPSPGSNVYRKVLTNEPFSYDLLTPAPGFFPGYSERHVAVHGGSDDLSHVVYSSTGQQTQDAPIGNFPKLYEWHEGALSLISRDPEGNPFTDATEAVVNAHAHDGISPDASRILFQNPPIGSEFLVIGPACPTGGCHIYMRENDTRTIDVSESECTVAPCPTDSSTSSFFLMGTPDVSKAFFLSEAKLSDDDTTASGRDLYMYTHGADPASEPDNLTFISEDTEPVDGTEAKVQTVLGTTADGDTVYFVADRQLVAGGPTEKGFKLYRWQRNGGSPTLEYLFMVPAENREQAINWYRAGGGTPEGGESPFSASTNSQVRAVSDDGRYLMIQSFSRLDPAVDYDQTIDIYRWDEANGPVCVTCQEPGEESNGNSWVNLTSVGGAFLQESMQPRLANMSADGTKIFFQSKDALLPADENGEQMDVYEWNDGTLGLISNGRGSVRSYLLGISDNAEDVFFVTNEKLVGWDIDPNNDIYDARVGGGFPEPGPAAPVCEGEQCRTAGTTPPPPVTAGTGVFEGPENKRQLAPCGRGFKKVKVRGKQVCKKIKKNRRKRKRNRAGGHNRNSGQTQGAGR